MRKFFEFCIIFAAGSVLYCLIEILWRGHTHWTMAMAGGLCFVAIYYINKHCKDVPVIVRCLTGAVVILTVEYATGFIVNIVLGWNVWDYSSRAYNIYGQICPLYGVLWFLLCIPASSLSAVLRKLINKSR